MIELKDAKQQLYQDLGWKPLNKTWAKLEILLGLVAVGCGLLAIGNGLRD